AIQRVNEISAQAQKIANTPALIKLSQFSNQLQKILKDPATQSFFQNLAYWVANQEKAAPHMRKILDEMESNSNFSEALETIPYRQLFRLIVDCELEDNVKLTDLINQDIFQKALLKYFDKINIGSHFNNRKVLIEEALKLYKSELYAGCLTLLHSQFEGILTDYLLFKGIIEKEIKNSKTNFTKVSDGKSITGLGPKIGLAKNISDTFKRLDTFTYDNNLNIKFHSERNDVLHGSNIANFNAERCFVIFIWIDSILDSIYTEEVVLKNLPPSAQ
ncbi:hypothetical protein OFN14_18245, partial [Acinetobacter baumannii]|nr:hypothetical protein [Acinetobacter baumannii]